MIKTELRGTQLDVEATKHAAFEALIIPVLAVPCKGLQKQKKKIRQWVRRSSTGVCVSDHKSVTFLLTGWMDERVNE